jgi:hypothetical protein
MFSQKQSTRRRLAKRKKNFNNKHGEKHSIMLQWQRESEKEENFELRVE